MRERRWLRGERDGGGLEARRTGGVAHWGLAPWRHSGGGGQWTIALQRRCSGSWTRIDTPKRCQAKPIQAWGALCSATALRNSEPVSGRFASDSQAWGLRGGRGRPGQGDVIVRG